MRSTTTYFAKDGRVYAKTPTGIVEAETALSARGRDLERHDAALVLARAQRADPPAERENPCECGQRPILQGDYYVCTNPTCEGYGQICSAAKKK